MITSNFCLFRSTLSPLLIVVFLQAVATMTAHATEQNVPENAYADYCNYKEDFSLAMGVLLADSIGSDYDEYVDAELLASAVLHQLGVKNDSQYVVSSTNNASQEGSAVSATRFPSISEAKASLANWQVTSRQDFGDKFIKAYRERFSDNILFYSQTDNNESDTDGILYRERKDSTGVKEYCETVRDRSFRATANNSQPTVCFMRKRIERSSACDIQPEGAEGIVVNHDKFDVQKFPKPTFRSSTKVIEGWNLVLSLLGEKRKDSAEDPKLIEFLIPSELAYGTEYSVSNIEPGEPLWFIAMMIDPPGSNKNTNN